MLEGANGRWTCKEIAAVNFDAEEVTLTTVCVLAEQDPSERLACSLSIAAIACLTLATLADASVRLSCVSSFDIFCVRSRWLHITGTCELMWKLLVACRMLQCMSEGARTT